MNIRNLLLKSLLCCALAVISAGCMDSRIKPDQCQSIVVPSNRDSAFVQWLISQEAEFKPKGCWQQHVQLGDEALAIAEGLGDNKSVMELSIQLASTWFYLGNSEKCGAMARQALVIAEKSKDRAGEVRSLYLLSASQRVQQNPEAVQTAKRALGLSNQHLPDDNGIKAKVLYNLGAAESDVKSIMDLESAAIHLEHAARLFNAEGKDYDVLRVHIRLARVEYLLGNYQQAKQTAESVRHYIKKPREEMIYFYQFAKIYHRLGKWQEAEKYAGKALAKAESLHAEGDLERISKLQAAITKHEFVEE